MIKLTAIDLKDITIDVAQTLWWALEHPSETGEEVLKLLRPPK